MNKSVKLIALNGSPNKNGNTATVIKWVADGAKAHGANVEWLQISDLDIKYCRGCKTCLKTGVCAIQDDLPLVLGKIRNADGYIVGSPVYGGNPTAQLKTLMDRITLLKLYAGILDDGYSVGVATSGIAPTKSVAKDAASMFGKRIGQIGVKCANLSGDFKSLDVDLDHKDKEKAKELGRELVKKCREGGKGWSLKSAWVNFLRKFFLKRLILRNKEMFSGIIKIWKDKGWL
jgi:multimeric flavodoxin WrbA